MSEGNGLHKKIRIMLWLTCIATIFLIGLVLYWLYYPYNPIDTYTKPYRVVYPEDKVVKQGGILVYEFDYEKKSPILPEIRRQFVDDLVFNVAGNQNPTVTDIGKGTARVEIDIPRTLPPGTYYLHIIAEYEMNPLRTIYYVNDTESFEVIGADE